MVRIIVPVFSPPLRAKDAMSELRRAGVRLPGRAPRLGFSRKRKTVMLILHDPRCAEYGSSLRPEQPARVLKSAAHLQKAHPAWTWRVPADTVSDAILKLAHTPAHLR